ncbi:MAG: DUF192 domain-containing protein [Actinomycetota bacterium]|nr:DUF192 domain-containing protein [Actinomycetota bacterium]
MRQVVLIDERGGRWRVDVPESHRERARGLLGRDGLEPDGALLLERCRSVHTFGMRFAIDVAILDRSYRVIAVRRARPMRVVLPRMRARHVLECAAGAAPVPGDQLSPA